MTAYIARFHAALSDLQSSDDAGLDAQTPLTWADMAVRAFDFEAASGTSSVIDAPAENPQFAPQPSFAAFSSGNLVIYRVGTGTGSLVNTGNAVFLDEYTRTGLLVQSIALPTAASGSNFGFFASGTATSEGLLTLSADGRYLLATGYSATTGATISGTTAAAVPRIVARVDGGGNVDTTTALTDFASGNNPRGAASTNGTDIWVDGGAGGVRYTTLGATTSTQLSTTVTNLRGVEIFDGQLYVSAASGAFRLATVGTGTPTTSGQTITNLPGFPTATGSPYAFFLADLTAAVAGNDTLYVADDGAGGGIQKYSLVAGAWTLNGTITAASVRGLTASVSGTTVSLFATTGGSGATGGGSLFSFNDTTGYNTAVSGSASVIATATTNTAFRGIAFAPQNPAATPTLSINDVTVAEGNAGTTTFTFTVQLGSPAGPGGVTFDIATANGTATAGSDYTARSLTAQTIASGLNSYTFTVDVTGDTAVEPNETFVVNITNVSGATVTDGQGVGTITNDDIVAAQTVEFAAASTVVSRIEPDSGTVTYSFTVTRGSATAGTLTVNGTVAAGATDAADFGGTLPTAFTATIADGATTGSFTVTVSGDDTIEADEAFTLTITGGTNSNASVVTVGAASVSTATILNDDAGAAIGGITVYDEALSLAGAATTPTATADVLLVRLGSFAGTGATAAGRSESIAYDGVTDRVFTTNAAQGRVDVTQLNADGSTTALASINLSTLPQFGTINSVAVRGGVIAVAFDNATAGQPGFVALYDTATTTLQANIQVGILPDQLTFTPDGQRILVANEGEAVSSTNNPAGSISIISLAGGAASASVVQSIGFGALTGFETELSARGVAVLGSQAAGNDIEPEYVTISPDGTRAYVVLQEVNAVAVIDLTNTTATAPLAILPLGGVDHNLAGNSFDPSDTGATISIAAYDAIGLLQPDAIASYSVGGFTYFITANEGDARVGSGITDSVRLADPSYRLDPTAYPNAAALAANTALGRLNVLTNIGDTDGDGDFDQIYTLGGRSLSIFRQNADGSFTKVRETGGEFEAIIARNNPTLFNVNQTLGPIDARSDDKGPEPEGVAIGQVGSRIYAFVVLERVGGVMVYDVTDPANAFYVGFRAPTGSDFGPETATFVSAADSPTGGALLLTANEISGTTTVYRVVPQTAGDDLIEGSAGDDALTGRGGNDVIRGLGGNDSLVGSEGNDTLEGGTGSNELQGGTGDDIYILVNAVDTVIEIAGEGTDTVQSAAAVGVLSANVENLTFTNDISHAGIGNGLDNVLTGGTGFDALVGLAGNDRIVGGSGAANELSGGTGNDTYVVGAVGDTILESTGEGTDTVETALTPFTLAANVENLTYTGSGSFAGIGNAANNVITGGAGSDSLAGLGGDDTLIGSAGAADELQGGTGNDTYVVQASGTTVLEAAGEGTDSVGTSLANFTLSDNVENLVYSGSSAFGGVGNALSNQITGGAGADTLVGLDGADILVGNAGADLLIGGDGADNFAYVGTEGASYDRIIDFTSASDRILLSNAGYTQTGTLTFESGAGATASTANSTFLYDTSTGIISYDADGTGAGAAVLLAQLNTGLILTVSDFAFF